MGVCVCVCVCVSLYIYMRACGVCMCVRRVGHQALVVRSHRGAPLPAV
jgi:hypothetical protein